jgi:ABC-type lipoprotein release transport system permease subunit
MGKFLLLAFRNVFRNRRRTVMTLLMVGGGVAGLLMVGGFFAFMFRGLRESTIRTGLGHIQIFTAEHFQRDEVHVLDTGISATGRRRQPRYAPASTCEEWRHGLSFTACSRTA